MSEKRSKINFSKNGEGKILLTQAGHSLLLDEILCDNMKIGPIEIDEEDIKKLVELKFYKTESIDALIKKLLDIKYDLMLESAS